MDIQMSLEALCFSPCCAEWVRWGNAYKQQELHHALVLMGFSSYKWRLLRQGWSQVVFCLQGGVVLWLMMDVGFLPWCDCSPTSGRGGLLATCGTCGLLAACRGQALPTISGQKVHWEGARSFRMSSVVGSVPNLVFEVAGVHGGSHSRYIHGPIRTWRNLCAFAKRS